MLSVQSTLYRQDAVQCHIIRNGSQQRLPVSPADVVYMALGVVQAFSGRCAHGVCMLCVDCLGRVSCACTNAIWACGCINCCSHLHLCNIFTGQGSFVCSIAISSVGTWMCQELVTLMLIHSL